MANEWLNDPQMCGYLRPQTLFGTKFESYLNRVKPKILTLSKKEQRINDICDAWLQNEMQKEKQYAQ